MIRFGLLIIAILAATGAAWMYSQQPEPVPVVEVAPPVDITTEPEIDMIKVLAASRDLVANESIADDSLVWTEWPREFALSSFIEQSVEPDALATYIGKQVREPVQIGEPLQRSLLIEAGQNTMSQTLVPGMRALAVRVTIEATAGGFIVPGDRVDVVHTQTTSGGELVESRVIASNVRVIALDQTTEQTDDTVILVNRTATLELDRDQVGLVTAAEQSGNLSLALRSRADEAEPPTYSPPLSQMLAPGMRALAVNVTIEASTGGFIVPGDRVDVVHTASTTDGDLMESQIIASNVRVIALDQTTQRGDNQLLLAQRTVTLELNQDQLGLVTTANQTGALSLALRSLADQSEEPTYMVPTPSVRVRRGGE